MIGIHTQTKQGFTQKIIVRKLSPKTLKKFKMHFALALL